MDLLKRDALLEKVGHLDEAPGVVSLEDFFIGNDDGGSVWCNVPNPVSPGRVFDILGGLRERDDVADVVMLVTQYDGGADEWPFSDTIYIITAAATAEVLSWLDRDYVPDEYWLATKPEELRMLNIPTGMHAVGLWWD